MKTDQGSEPPNLPSPEWVGDGKSQETAILFTNAKTQLEHIHMQHHFVRSQGIVGLRTSVKGEEGFLYDLWSTGEGQQLWFKVPVSPGDELLGEIEREINRRQSSYAKFESKLNKLLADDQGQEEDSSPEAVVAWNGEFREPILRGITWGIQKAELRAIYKGLLFESVPDILQDLEVPIHGHLAAVGFFFGGQGLHMVAASLHFGAKGKRLSQNDVVSKSNRGLAGLKELYGEPSIARPWNGHFFDYRWRSPETLIQFACDGIGGWGVHYRSMKLDEFARDLDEVFAKDFPRWAQSLAYFMRPTPEQIVRLENLRQRMEASEEEFSYYVGGHPVTTRKTLSHYYEQLKKQNPGAPEDDILTQLVLSRCQADLLAGTDLYGHGQTNPDELESRARKLVAEACNLEALTEIFVRDEIRNDIPQAPGYEWAAAELKRILEG